MKTMIVVVTLDDNTNNYMTIYIYITIHKCEESWENPARIHPDCCFFSGGSPVGIHNSHYSHYSSEISEPRRLLGIQKGSSTLEPLKDSDEADVIRTEQGWVQVCHLALILMAHDGTVFFEMNKCDGEICGAPKCLDSNVNSLAYSFALQLPAGKLSPCPS